MTITTFTRLLAAIAVALITGFGSVATASASTGGAERAVKRAVRYDYGPSYVLADCNPHGRGYYTCDLFVDVGFEGRDRDGRARVHQYGNSYSVDYRLYW
jgi:hypothetical protein